MAPIVRYAFDCNGLGLFGMCVMPYCFAGFAIMTIGLGVFTLLEKDSSQDKCIGYQNLRGAGAGLVIPTLLPAITASLSEADTAPATATWAILRSLGLTWGTAIPAVIFNNRVATIAGCIEDSQVAATVVGGLAYEHAVASFVNSLKPETSAQFVSVFSDGLKRLWMVVIAFAVFGRSIVSLDKECKLRDELITEFDMVDKDRPVTGPGAVSPVQKSS